MSDLKFEIKLGEVDYDKLNSDADFRAEAERLLPEAMKQASKGLAEGMWKAVEKLFGSSKRSQFIREKSAEIAKDTKTRREVKDYLVGLLKEEKKKHPPE